MMPSQDATAHDPVDRIGYVAARITLAAIFLFTGVTKLVDAGDASADIAEAGLPFPAVLAMVAGLVELLCGTLLVLGKATQLAATGLVLFLLTVTLLMENPLRTGPDVGVLIDFLKNLAIMGGLLMVVLREHRERRP